MNLERAGERAQSVSGETAAAKLYADIEYELAMGEPDSGQEQAGETALATLESRFPGIKGRANDVVENGHIPNMSRKGWSNTHPAGPHEGRRRRGTPPPTARKRVEAQRQQRSSRSSSAGRRAGGYASSAWSSASGSDWGQLLIWAFMAGMGLSIGYRLLTHPKGVSELFAGAANVTRAVVSTTVDPLNPSGPPRTANLTRKK